MRADPTYSLPLRVDHHHHSSTVDHSRTDEKDLSDYFSTYGALADVYIPKPHRGFAFITFEKGEDAEIVLKVSAYSLYSLTWR